MSIYTDLKAAGVELSNHHSDLYAKATPESRAIVEAWEFKSNVATFRNNIDGEMWFDIPFAYDPYWENCPTSKPQK